MSAIAGRVLILPKGDYDASTMYEFLDLVNHNSSSWLAKKASQGVEPSDENSEFWQKFGSSVTPDGVTIVIDENGVISAVGGTAEKVTYENESVADVTNVKEALDVIFDGGIDVDISSLTTNMFKPPTYTSKTDDGVTCTYNVDGSLTFSGQSSSASSGDFPCFEKNSITLKKGKYKIMLNPSAESGLSLIIGGGGCTSGLEYTKIYDSAVIEIPQTGTIGYFLLQIPDGTTMDNVTIRPMLTTNLEATLDDFVPYTGNTGKLNGDVAEIRKTYFSPHNKPTGTYTGNGSATARTINIGGIGETLRIFSSAYGMSFIGKYGGVGIGTNGIAIITSCECKFENGVLTMASTSNVLNANAYVYEYDSL